MLILPDWLVTTATVEPMTGHGLRVVDGRVDEVGPYEALVAAHPDDPVVPAPDRIALPGFVNAHVHLYGVLAHGIPVDAAPDGFWSFLDDYWWPKVEDALDVDMIVIAADWVCAELLKSGVTTFYDILEAPNALPDALLAEKEVVERRGIRAVLSFEATERAGPQIAESGLVENVALIEASRDSDLVSGLMCYHTAFTCSADYIERAFGLATEHDVLCHAHCNEGVHEPEWCEANLGLRTMEFYDQLGVASPRFLASQCVQLSERERAIIAERGVRVTHMPLANCEVGGGIAPIPELLAAGVTVGLGSDGYVNDFYEVMRGAFLLHKARLLDPGVMPAGTVLTLATEGGASALGLADVGRIEPGWRADIQLVDATLPTPVTADNLYDQLVLWRNHTHVTDVLVGGRWRVRNGEVLDADLGAMRAAVHDQANRL
ncbi:MAG: amidohydrolase family protein, partial [Acidimicrobiia bacterium]|nr:amidohydrolase family protein [Acidimicrobiia bacterium]